ncbi:hypothetical protein P1X15_30765 [Runella sp. MFBS21]|uniref:hypothetical protein n=1 Tax=Runella sp. MFBS21 TaxID=3034018 RepID=UPI0023F9A790|nr:hypothetical protein [Runella sp. MFBS21]MDF7822038.1 hypothetical protein [Runella sp. MFBS21]
MKQFFNLKNTTIVFFAFLSLFILYIILIPEYIFTHYKLPGCQIELTKIEFKGYRFDEGMKFDRELFFVYGFCEEKQIPKDAYELRDFSGFDSIFSIKAFCSNDTIILNHGYGLEKKGNPIKLIARQLENIEYINCCEKGTVLIVSE